MRLSARGGWVLAGVAVLAAFLLLGLLADAFAPSPQGPADSSFSTSSAGVAAWAELLGRAGHPVSQLRQPLASAPLPAPGGTLVVLDAGELSRRETGALSRFVRAGGSLVIGGGDVSQAAGSLVARVPQWASPGPTLATVTASGRRYFPAVSEVQSAGDGTFQTDARGAALAAGPGQGLLVIRHLGQGRVAMLADSSPLQNQLLATDDNAQLAIDLAGRPGTPVSFAEQLHGFGEATGLAAIPVRWWFAFAGLLLAAAAWALSRGRRLGPAEAVQAPGPPPRSAYVQGMTALLLRSRDTAGMERLLSGSEEPRSGDLRSGGPSSAEGARR